MTDTGDRSLTSALTIDGFRAEVLATAIEKSKQENETLRFWASNPRPIGSKHREIMEVSFGAQRMVNHLSFKIGRFPCVLGVEYLDPNGEWKSFSYPRPRRAREVRRETGGEPVRLVVSESVPARVNSAQAKGHPQHFGKNHWMQESWRVKPVLTQKIRFILTRNHRGTPPKNFHGHEVAYSVALKNVVIGYRVTNHEDLPSGDQPWWASSKDILGSQVVYSLYDQPAGRVIDGSRETFWRSEPQPFPFAVVNMYLDLRKPDGDGQVVDRFWVDPVTNGVACNLYYSNGDPDGSFEGVSTAVPAQYRTEVGLPGPVLEPETSDVIGYRYGPDIETGIEIDNAYVRFDVGQPWWVGLDLSALVDTTDGSPRPIISLGTTRLLQDGDQILLVAQSGATAAVVLDPEFVVGTRYRLVASYHPEDEIRGPYLRLTYAIVGHLPQTAEIAVSALDADFSTIRVGLHPDSGIHDVSASTIVAGVVKSEVLDEETEAWFLDEGEAYVADPLTPSESRGTAVNARLRIHPGFYDDANPFGVVGGVGDRFDRLEWTPIPRDYVLRQGYLHLPPTRARYWKFEFTNLLPQVYENFVTIDRDVLLFPPDVVAAYQAANGLADEQSAPSGINTLGNISRQVSDGTTPPIKPVRPEDTNALVVKDPVLAQQAATTGWIWNYQPWHVGAGAPRFMGTQYHRYESLRVEHSTKVGFFVGVREIQPMRTDFTFADDTQEYVEHFYDTAFVDLTETGGVEFGGEGLRSTASLGTVTSEGLYSYRNIRGVQFATIETDAYEVLPDPDFNADDLDFWNVYGDSSVERLGPNDVLVSRGWQRLTYGDLQAFTYGDLESRVYGQLEGNAQSNGAAEGGLSSQVYTPTGAGEIVVIAEISSASTMHAPVTVEIVSTYGDRVVASSTHWVQGGETAVLKASFVPGEITERRTYGDVETMVSVPTTYGELEDSKYWEIEYATGIASDVYARVRQVGGTHDDFHIHRIGLYDSLIAWSFSNDDGVTWWRAIGVKNDPDGVLIFPEDPAPTPTSGKVLRWRAEIFREDASISALHIRPWYGTRERSVPGAQGLDVIGPNRSTRDALPSIRMHPMWTDRFQPIEQTYTEPVVVPFWRNLVINPSLEITIPGEAISGWSVTGGEIAVVEGEVP